MQITFIGKHVEVTPAMKEYAEAKLQKLNRFFDHIQEIHVTEAHTRGQVSVEVTVKAGHALIRAEEHSTDMNIAVDQVVDKLERQLTRYKDRFVSRKREALNGHKPAEIAVPAVDITAEEEQIPSVVRTKRFAIKPMDPEEAAQEMELVSHDFYVFRNAKSDQVNVIYRRRDGHYGLIEPIV
jgi:putative sigma-54 modulation protein